MAEIAKTGVPSPSTPNPSPEHGITGLKAGEAIAGGDACYIKASDGKVWKCDGTAANEKAICAGFAGVAADAGRGVTLFHGIMFGYGPNVAGTASNPGIPLYLSDTVTGGLASVATTGGASPVAYVIGDGRIFAKGSY